MPGRVLVVDDDPLVCELIHDVLESAGIEARTVTDSTRVAAHLGEEKFEAVFLDVGMPPPDGIEVARQMRAGGLNQKTPIVIITGETGRSVLTRAFQVGANFFLFKPVQRHSLLRLIRVTEGSIMRERKRFARVRRNCKVTMESGEQRLHGTTVDLSLDGLLVKAGEVFSVGYRVQFSLELAPGTPSLRASARVMRLVGDDCMGLQFENVGAADSTRLEEFLLPLILSQTDLDSPS
jgi:two-component system chemotaxis response regulator CheY